MKTKVCVLFVIKLFSSLSFLHGQQSSKPTRFMVMQDVVYPYKVDAYEKAQKEMNGFITKTILRFHGDVCSMIIIPIII
jgi:hypothetical protein